MKLGNLCINDNCVQCGSCLGFGYDFIKETGLGSVEVEKGTFLDGNSEELKNLKEICPVNAFEYDDAIEKKEVLLGLRQDLANVSGCYIPTSNALRFDKSEYSIDIPITHDCTDYIYKSDDEAERAALNEFVSKMYSQIDNIILKVISQYRVKYLRPYDTKEIGEGSVYAKSNAEANEIIEGIRSLMGDDLSKEFSDINVFPDDYFMWNMIRKGELMSTEIIGMVRKQLDYEADRYDYCWNTDSIELYKGEDIFGKSKYKEMYRYTGLNKAFEKLANDLMDCFYYADGDIEDRAVGYCRGLVESYNKVFREEVNKRVRIVDDLLSEMKGNVSTEPIQFKHYDDIYRYIFYDVEKDSLSINHDVVEDKECYVAGNDNVQFFFDKRHLYRRYINKDSNVVISEKMFPEERFQKTSIQARHNVIVLHNDNNDIIAYHIDTGKTYNIANKVKGPVCLAGGLIFYGTWEGDNSNCMKYLYQVKTDGSCKTHVDTIFGCGDDIVLFSNLKEDGKRLKYDIWNVIKDTIDSREIQLM